MDICILGVREAMSENAGTLVWTKLSALFISRQLQLCFCKNGSFT